MCLPSLYSNKILQPEKWSTSCEAKQYILACCKIINPISTGPLYLVIAPGEVRGGEEFFTPSVKFDLDKPGAVKVGVLMPI